MSSVGRKELGKYAHLNLPRIVSTEPSRQDKVDLKKLQILEKLPLNQQESASIFASYYAGVRREKDELKQQLAELNLEVEAAKQLLVEQYEAHDIESLKLSNGDTVRIQIEPYLVVEMPGKFRLWCVRNGYEQSLQLPWSTANSVVKALLLKGKPEPDGTRAYMLSKAVFSAGDKDHAESEGDDE